MDKSSSVLLFSKVSRFFTQADTCIFILKSLDLSIETREKVALVGPSGVGKTTLLHIAGLLDKPSEGGVFIQGKDTSQMHEKERTLIRRNTLGFIYQHHHLLPEFTALENVMMPAFIAKKTKKEAQERAHYLLAHLGLNHRLHHLPSQLSGGEQQRVAIARSLTLKPALILADEPTGNLDNATAEQVMQLFLETTHIEGSSLLMVTHNMQLASRMDRIITLA